MEASLTSMMSSLLIEDENPQQSFNDIFANKYRKFISLYWLLKEQSSFIKKITYKETNPETMRIKIHTYNMEKDALISLIENKAADMGLDIDIETDGNKIILTITRDESDLY